MGKQSKRKVGKKKGSRRKGQRGGVIRTFRTKEELIAAMKEYWEQESYNYLVAIGALGSLGLGVYSTATYLDFFVRYGGLDSMLAGVSAGARAVVASASAGLSLGAAAMSGARAVASTIGSTVLNSGLGVMWMYTRLQSILPNINIATLLGAGAIASRVPQATGAIYNLYQDAIDNDLLFRDSREPRERRELAEVVDEATSEEAMWEYLARTIMYTMPETVVTAEQQAERDAARARADALWVAIEAQAGQEQKREVTMVQVEVDAEWQAINARLVSMEQFQQEIQAILESGSDVLTPETRAQIEELLSCPQGRAHISTVRFAMSGVGAQVANAGLMVRASSVPEDRSFAMSSVSVYDGTESMPAFGGAMCVQPRRGWEESLRAMRSAFVEPESPIEFAILSADSLAESVKRTLSTASAVSGGVAKRQRTDRIQRISSTGTEIASVAEEGAGGGGAGGMGLDEFDKEDLSLRDSAGSQQSGLSAGSLSSFPTGSPQNEAARIDVFDQSQEREEGEEGEGQDGGSRRSKKRRNNKKRRSTKKRRQNKRRR